MKSTETLRVVRERKHATTYTIAWHPEATMRDGAIIVKGVRQQLLKLIWDLLLMLLLRVMTHVLIGGNISCNDPGLDGSGYPMRCPSEWVPSLPFSLHIYNSFEY